jgi:hypothetical protein
MKKFLLLLLLYLMSISALAEMHKVSDSGEILALESEAWSCVLDDKQSLVREVKSEEEGVQFSLNTYTWFDGESGRDNGTFSKNCYWGKSCNTQSYIEDINEAELCTYSDWRLPTRDELKSIVDYYGDSDILINSLLFPNTQMDTYWTSMSAKDNPSLAYEIPFFFGGSVVRDKTIDPFVRLVRSAD